jgi:hypothetical protein
VRPVDVRRVPWLPLLRTTGAFIGLGRSVLRYVENATVATVIQEGVAPMTLTAPDDSQVSTDGKRVVRARRTVSGDHGRKWGCEDSDRLGASM